MRAVRDVVVVGGGVVGCVIAYELARRGTEVVVLDARRVGEGASQASAGMLTPYIEAESGSPLLDLGVRSLEMYERFVAEVSRDSGQPVPYARHGSLQVAAGRADLDRLQSAARALEATGVEYHWFDAADVRQAEPQLGPGVDGALLIPTHGHVALRELTRAAAAAAGRHGAEFLESTRVRRLERVGAEGIRVETEQTSILARRVVLAAGSWTASVAATELPVVPVRPVKGQLVRLSWPGEPLRRIVWGSRCYVVPLAQDSVLVGATVEEAGFDERPTVDGVLEMLDGVRALIPTAGDATFCEARVGLRPGTPDELPIIGPSRDLEGVYYATGHYRSGALLAPLTAALVAQLLVDGRSDPMLDALSPSRFADHSATMASQ